MYGYDELIKDFDLARQYGAKVFSIGKSGGGRDILCAHIGTDKGPQLIITGAIHAREHITAKLVSWQALTLCRHKLRGGVCFLPMINPDGVELCINGASSIKSTWNRDYAKLLNGGDDFSLWKANMFGVDLNVNYPARYGTGLSNTTEPGPENYIGREPLSEPESRALAEFIKKIMPRSVVCYHCKGEIIFWRFYQQKRLARDYNIAKKLSAATGYALCGEEGSAGGVKDWCIQKLGLPAFTIEVGNDSFSHPFPYSEFDVICKQNSEVVEMLLKQFGGSIKKQIN